MKKLFGLAVAMMLGLTLVGCEDTMDDTTIEEVETKQEEMVEEPEEILEDNLVEEPEEEVEMFDTEKLNYYMTTNLTDSEYGGYFNNIKWIGDQPREIEFDGQILMVTPHEKYSTRCELLLASGDYTDGNFTGPYVKTRDIAYTQLNGMINEGYNVKVRATIDKYDTDSGLLIISVKEIKAR